MRKWCGAAISSRSVDVVQRPSVGDIRRIRIRIKNLLFFFQSQEVAAMLPSIDSRQEMNRHFSLPFIEELRESYRFRGSDGAFDQKQTVGNPPSPKKKNINIDRDR